MSLHKECQLDEAGMMEWMEYWVMPLEWVDRAVWVSKVELMGELMGDLEMDMPKFFPSNAFMAFARSFNTLYGIAKAVISN